ncbi:heavy metal translocating P-type ATPase [Alkalibacterium olivapovliticus]|uniref:Cd(2+)-exporting ATPase n=1 Tax=Alkalibacterium olivapovliticus TaxID=99907 RepID=A0A2T0W7F9_9LACT|nr:heavy metal translocating P-type ATPase [Alkalibacterium olivapovliticus]PRY82640.1 Cd2+/Zn2+-exporting ATPase [Alkalibacterium olivapovliticus]
MSFQQKILSSKNKITLISGILIVIGFIAHFGFGNTQVFNIAFIIASILGVAPIAIQAFGALKVKVISIDVLVTIAVIGAVLIQNYEESAIVTFLFLFGSWLEARTLNSTRSAIKELTEMAPEVAFKQMENGEFEEVDIWDVDEGDILQVRTGGKVPVDGTVIIGEGHINEASITGEADPVRKETDSEVFAGTILENGTIQIRADRVGEDTTFGKIIELVEEAQDSKSAAERFIDKFSQWYTPVVLVGAFLTWVFTQNVELAITILVLGCPGALVIGVPVSNVAGIGNGAKNGILFKGSETFQDLAKVDSILFDKTGTLTVGNPEVAESKTYGDADLALSYLASVEGESDHPLAKAVLSELGDIELYPVDNTDVVKGGGIVAEVNGSRVAVGNVALMEQEKVKLNAKARKDFETYEKRGNSLVITAVDGELKALMGIRDQIRPGIKEDLQAMKNLGVKNLVVLSGDNQGTVDLVAKELGLTNAIGNLLPEDKAAYLKELQAEGEIVAFVGDGVNDSPSLAMADIGVAMGSGTDVAIETSDLVLMNSDMSRLQYAIGLAKTTVNNMRQNIVIAIGVVLVLLSAVFFSEWMNMSIGMLVHEASILVVIVNGMRLLRYNLKGSKDFNEKEASVVTEA